MKLALYALGRRMLSMEQLRDYLVKKEIPSEEINPILRKLRELGYLDDAAFAENYVRARISMGGRRKLAWELKQKGVDAQTIEAALETVDQEAELEAAIRYALRAMRGETDRNARNRAYGALQRRGYSGDITGRAMRLALEEIENEDDSTEDAP